MKYIQLFKTHIQVSLAYRMEPLVWFIISSISTFTIALILFNAASSNAFTNYNSGQVATYIVLSFVLERFLIWYFAYWFGNSINRGKLSFDLIKPFKYLVEPVVSEFTGKIIYTIPYIFISIFLIIYFGGRININTNAIPIFIIIFALAICINITIAYMLSFVAFFTIKNNSVVSFFFGIIPLLSGRSFPLDIMPTQIFNILTLTPFPYTFFYPVKILSSNLASIDYLKVIFIQITWLFMFILIATYMHKKGIKKYESAGI